MLFSSSIFLFLFLPVVLILYYGYCRDHRTAQNIVLLLASLFFYAWGEPWFVLVMIASIIVNYGMGLWIDWCQRHEKNFSFPVFLAVLSNLTLLFSFKYLTFFVENINKLGLELPVPQLPLPIGISFFTFQALSYVLDIARKKAEVQKNLFSVALYISFFPQLIAGPIVKYETVAHEIRHRRENWEDFSTGASRFIVGLCKKVLISNQLALVADTAFGLEGGALTTSMAWLGAICFNLQIYYDFSGYSDMAIGLGRMFGFHFLENFNYQYISCSMTEYWRRSHISLGAWFRDYVYFPLGGSRAKGLWRQVRNLLVVWLLTGLWHGANWIFVCWGLFHFTLLVLEKFFHLGRGWPKWAQWLFTITMVNFAGVIFRSDSVAVASTYIQTMLQFTVENDALCQFLLREHIVTLIFAVIFSTPIAPYVGKQLEDVPSAPFWNVVYALGLGVLFLASVSFLVKGTYNPFIYFNF